MSSVKDTYVHQTLTGKYIALKHIQTRVGWDWQFSIVDRMPEAWQGQFPTNPRQIHTDQGLALKSFVDGHGMKLLHIRVTTTTSYALIPEKNHD